MNPANRTVITTALNLIYQELQKLEIDVHIPIPPSASVSSQSQTRHHSQSPSQTHGLPLPPMAHALGSDPNSRHDSPVHHHPHHSSHPSSSMGTPVSSASSSVLPGYNFPQPHQAAAGFDVSTHGHHHHHHSSTSGLPPMGATHLLGGMPNAVMTLDNSAPYEITPEVFEAFSYAEPISTNMTPGFDNGWVRP